MFFILLLLLLLLLSAPDTISIVFNGVTLHTVGLFVSLSRNGDIQYNTGGGISLADPSTVDNRLSGYK